MSPTGLIPAPRAVRDGGPGTVVLDEDTAIAAGPGTATAERWLRATLGAALGLPLPPAEQPSARTVALRVADGLAPEAYRLTIAADSGVEIVGGGPAGVFWGAQSLRQLLGPDAFRRAPVRPGRTWSLPCGSVEDAPRFGWRGLLLDVARHFLPKDDVLRMVDLLAAHKLNVLHLHLTDDQGWRVEIERYPELTVTGAWRRRSRRGHGASRLWDERPHGGYYTRDDLREIVAYAAERHVTVVPEIDIPGHSQAAIAAYPELGNRDVPGAGGPDGGAAGAGGDAGDAGAGGGAGGGGGAALSVWDGWGVSPNVLAPTDATLRFYEGVLEEVLEIFPGTFVHIGGDECPKDQWRASPAAQARIRELGLADEDELQSWFIRHFDRWLTARGRRLIGWDEILQGGLAEGAAVSSWRGYAGGVAAARAGHDVVMCPEQHVYLDHRQAPGADEPVPIGYVRTLEDVYRFEPVPPQLTAREAERVLGTQANVWTEAMEDRRRVDYQVFPRLAAFAEVAWSALPAPAERDFTAFERRMAEHYARLDALGVEYRPPSGPRPWQTRPGVLGRPIEGSPPIV
ncbi:beta-N-acetylhexosaminidase [Streptomyces sp. URMC 123]|uniref:beta-N-acetylhexosaminidase n=1 Tax=Streptomyces sp. URMC 123 TaxID=3423403 RepID=UPI003F1CCDB5